MFTGGAESAAGAAREITGRAHGSPSNSNNTRCFNVAGHLFQIQFDASCQGFIHSDVRPTSVWRTVFVFSFCLAILWSSVSEALQMYYRFVAMGKPFSYFRGGRGDLERGEVEDEMAASRGLMIAWQDFLLCLTGCVRILRPENRLVWWRQEYRSWDTFVLVELLGLVPREYCAWIGPIVEPDRDPSSLAVVRALGIEHDETQEMNYWMWRGFIC